MAGARLPGATVNYRALLIATVASLLAAVAFAAPPLAGSWNITPSGSAASSGELLFRVAPGGDDAIRITVPVRSGSDDVAVARAIRQAFDSRLGRTYKVELGEGANVLISDSRGKPSLAIELLDSAIDGLRVSVRNIEPAATPTVPSQSAPAIILPPPTPAQPGAATPPTENPQQAMPPADPPPMGTPPPDTSQQATPPRNSPGPTSPVTTAPGDNSQPSAPPPGGTPSTPPGAPPPAVPPITTPPPT
jgi:hypothetical protein